MDSPSSIGEDPSTSSAPAPGRCSRTEANIEDAPNDEEVPSGSVEEDTPDVRGSGPWQCETCTFVNDNTLHLACAICGTVRDAQGNLPEDPDKVAGPELIEDIEAPMPSDTDDENHAIPEHVGRPEMIEDSEAPMPTIEETDNNGRMSKPVAKWMHEVDDGFPNPEDDINRETTNQDSEGQQPSANTPSIARETQEGATEDALLGEHGQSSASMSGHEQSVVHSDVTTTPSAVFPVPAESSSSPIIGTELGQNDESSIEPNNAGIVTRPPSQSRLPNAVDEPSESGPPILEATLVRDTVYDAVPLAESRSWWKRHQSKISLVAVLIAVGISAASIVTVVRSQRRDGGNEHDAWNNNASSIEEKPAEPALVYYADQGSERCHYSPPGNPNSGAQQKLFQTVEECCTTEFPLLPVNECRVNSLGLSAPTTEPSFPTNKPTERPSKYPTRHPTNQPTRKPAQIMPTYPPATLEPTTAHPTIHPSQSSLFSSTSSTKESSHSMKLILANVPDGYVLPPPVKSDIVNHIKEIIEENLDASFDLVDVTLEENSNRGLLSSMLPTNGRRLASVILPLLVKVKGPSDVAGWSLLYIMSSFQGTSQLESYLKSIDPNAFKDVSVSMISADQPTKTPTRQPTSRPSNVPTQKPTEEPTESPTSKPTDKPTTSPTEPPTNKPTYKPTKIPTKLPTTKPTEQPSKYPTRHPTRHPTRQPTRKPTRRPTQMPTTHPTAIASLVWKQQGQTLAGDADMDQAGYSVAISSNGTLLCMGAPGKFDNTDRPGYVKIYRNEEDGSNWDLLKTVDGASDGDLFGRSLAMSDDGKTIAIGAPGSWKQADRPGYVRVYQFEGSSLQQLGQTIEGEAPGDQSGVSVSLSANGRTVAIGANGNDGIDSASGHVRVYRLEGEGTAPTWEKVGQDLDGEAAYDNSGSSVSLSADGATVAIGAYGNAANGDSSGHVRVYRINSSGSSWTKLGQDLDGGTAGDRFGRSVSLSSDSTTVVIGAPGPLASDIESDKFDARPGYVQIYHWNGGPSWQLVQTIFGDNDGDWFGRSVSFSGNSKTLGIGADENDDNGENSGHVKVYVMEGEGVESNWKQLGLSIPGEAAFDLSGTSVALSGDGNSVVIGSFGANDDNGRSSGHVRVFGIEY